MNNSMQRSALDNVIAQQRGVKREGTDRYAFCCRLSHRTAAASAEIWIHDKGEICARCRDCDRNRKLWQTVWNDVSETDFEQLIAIPSITVARTSGDCCGTLSASAEHAIYSHVRPGRCSSHGGRRHGI